MNPINFTIDGVGLRTNPNAIDYYPDGVDPYDHQVEMADIISNDDDFVAVNTAPTGGGKTWSYVIPAVHSELDVLVAYPTNALARDQKESIEEYRDKHCEDGELGIVPLNGDAVREGMKDTPFTSTGDYIDQQVREVVTRYDSVIALTTPDMFTVLRHSLHKNTYAKTETNHFDMVVFDEFHIADVKGWNSLVFLIDEMYADENTDASKFVFLSATPDPQIEDRLRNGVDIPKYHDCIEAAQDGQKPWSKVSDKDNWRAVMPPVEMNVRPGETWQTADQLLDEENFDSVLDFCRQGRTVVIVDGIDEVDRTYTALSANLPNLTVERIDGLNKGDVERKLDEFDVLVSNKAVEVGIDFDVDQLLMSGYEYSSFLQRLGRLRNKSEQLNAMCYVPRRTLDGLHKNIPNVQMMLKPDEPVPRWKFEELATDLFPKPRDPELFAPMYSAIEAFMHIDAKKERLTDEKRREYIVESRKRLNNHFFEPYDWELTEERLRTIINKGRSPLNKPSDTDDPFADTLLSYRNSGLNTLAYKYDEDEVQSYSLWYFLRHGRVEFVTEEEFLDRVPDDHHKDIHQKKHHSVGYCIYYGRRDASTNDDEAGGRNAQISAPQTLRELTELDVEDRKPVTLSGLEVRVEEHVPGLEKLNAELVEESFLCYPIEGSSYTVQTDYNLDDFFFLQDLTDLRGNYSLALGLNALYLHCHVLKRCEQQAAPDPMPVQ